MGRLGFVDSPIVRLRVISLRLHVIYVAAGLLVLVGEGLVGAGLAEFDLWRQLSPGWVHRRA
ncbi:hypothetical protein NORO109296_24860 [Nocardiopsis rhodophaea]